METIQILGVQDGSGDIIMGTNAAETRSGPAEGGIQKDAPKPAPVAETAPAAADALYLPDGTALRLTLSRKIWLGRIFGREADDAWAGPNRALEDQTLLFLAGNLPSVWLAPGREDGGPTRPLVQRPRALQEAMDTWVDEKMGDFSIEELRDLATALWEGEHATQVVALSKKKEARMKMRADCGHTGQNNC